MLKAQQQIATHIDNPKLMAARLLYSVCHP